MNIVFVDGSIVPLYKHGGDALKETPQAIGRVRTGLGTRIHVAMNKDSLIA